MSSIQQILTSDQITEISNYINQLRKLHQAPPLIWDDNIADFSQSWSDYLLSSNMFKHSNTNMFGENLAYFQGYGVDPVTLLKLAIDSWYNEIKLYDFNNPVFSDQTGHFTCLVWASSTSYAVGFSLDPTNQKVIITMNTSPPGNVTGEFATNVFPVKVPLPPPPLPVPLPTPPYDSAKVNNIINSLNNVIQLIMTKRPKYFILMSLNGVIHDLKTTTILPISATIIKQIEGIMHVVMVGKINYYTTLIINNIINSLKQYL
jgi:uncharacterized protein YkwD